MKVVVIDDMMISARLVCEFLKKVDDVVTESFTDPAEGLAHCLENDDVDLVLVDYQMPGLNGMEVIERIRESKAREELPVVMVTAMDDKDILRQAFEAGANDFLGKPVEPVELTARVQNLLALKHTTMELHKLANTDVLTNVRTRRYFFESAEVEIQRCNRYGHDLSVIMLDADHFKNINDTYGHEGGDDVLRFLADECRTVLRDLDFIGRIGGEEFCICLPETPTDGASLVADRLRAAIENGKITLKDGREVGITVSIGLATWQSGEEFADTMRRSDEALYEAKENGRNRVVLAA